MNKYLIFASDERSYLDLKNIVLELKSRNLPYFFLYARTPHRVSPIHNLNSFSYDCNIDVKNPQYTSKTLGVTLPFKPDILLITNENWEPEKSILWEFKQWGCFIGGIENTSRIYAIPKLKLELECKKSFPVNCVDIFFDHSEWSKETKIINGWHPLKSIVTGNPRNDNLSFKETPNKNIIIFYGSMENEHHSILIESYKNIQSKLKNWQVLYKPHPSEFKNFPNDFNNIEIINTQDEYFKILPKTPYHIGIFSSIMYYPLILNKNVVFIDSSNSGMDKELNLETYKGHPFNFWSRVFSNEVFGSSGFKSFEDFSNYLGKDLIEKCKERNQILEDTLKKHLVPYEKDLTFIENTSNNKKVLKYFDEFNDGRASKRIIDYIEYGYEKN